MNANHARQRNLAIVAPTAYLSGGVQTWLDYIVSGLIARDWLVTVLPVHGFLHDSLSYVKQHPFGSVHRVINPTGSREGRLRALMRAIKDTRPDVVLSANIVDAYEAVARLRRSKFAGVRVAMALHGFNTAFFQDMKTYDKVLDGVIATNRLGVAAAAAIGGIDKSRIHYAPCGVEIGKRDAVVSQEGALTLLYSGRFDQKEKNVLDLPKILAALVERQVPWRLKLAGSGPDEAELKSALSSFGERVEFLGQMDARTLSTTFYQPGAILLITSPSESGPLVAWEAMAHGIVVVTSRYLGIGREGSLRHGENCMIFPVSDSSAAADAIVRLRDAGLRKRLADEGYELVKRRYTREVSIAAWDRALSELLATPSQVSAETAIEPPAAGRLDRFFGSALAETIRSAMGIRFRHRDPGAEWPHSYSGPDEPAFADRLRALD